MANDFYSAILCYLEILFINLSRIKNYCLIDEVNGTNEASALHSIVR